MPTNEDPVGRYTEQDEHLAMGLADQAAQNLTSPCTMHNHRPPHRAQKQPHFQEQLAGDGARCREATGLCLAIVDVDHFKKFNDTYGHKVGDFVLMQTAQILKSACRTTGQDQAFRYGGEEFCMLLTETELEAAREQMDAFRVSVERAEHMWQDQKLSVTCSVGICHFPSGAKNTSDLFEFADNALYMAKQAGRNRVCVAGASVELCWRARVAPVDSLRPRRLARCPG